MREKAFDRASRRNRAAVPNTALTLAAQNMPIKTPAPHHITPAKLTGKDGMKPRQASLKIL